MKALPLLKEHGQKELHIIQQIAYANHIPRKWLHKLHSNEEQQIRDNQNNDSHKRWLSFTNFGPQV
jgi:hypothetical protein